LLNYAISYHDIRCHVIVGGVVVVVIDVCVFFVVVGYIDCGDCHVVVGGGVGVGGIVLTDAVAAVVVVVVVVVVVCQYY